MTAEQIKIVRDFSNKDDGTGKHMAGRLAIVFNNEVCFVDTRDFIIWDDANELVHCIRANSEDPVSQSLLPYRITTGMYANCQYLEGLYDMRSFKEAIQELFVKTGLINASQQEEILKWANGIRNIHPIPKAPGPYFKDTVLPPSVPYTPEVRRDDGIYRAAPTNFITYQERIDNFIEPAIERSTLKPIKIVKRIYDIDLSLKDSVAANIKTIIEAFPKNNIQRACFTDHMVESVAYSPKNDNMTDLVASVRTISKTIIDGERCTLIIDAFNTRCSYEFYFHKKKGETQENPNLVIKEIRDKINSFFDDFKSECGSVYKRVGLSIQGTINNTNIDSDINSIIDFITSIEGVTKIRWFGKGTSIIANIDDSNTIESLKKEVLYCMPENNNGTTTTGSVEALTSTGASVTYRLRVTYFNQSKCVAKIAETYYNTLTEACNVGGIVDMLIDVTEPVTVPAGKEVTLNLNGHNLGTKDGYAIKNNGNLTIDGNGVVEVILNLGVLNIQDGTYIDTISTNTAGHTTISGGDFTTCDHITTSGNLTISGGTFSADKVEALTPYLATGFVFNVSGNEATPTKMTIDQKVDNIIANLSETDGLIITENAEGNRTYDITTSNGIITNSTLIDKIAALDELTKITIAVEGADTSVTYVPGDDLDVFKSSVDALVPKDNTDPMVILVMTVE